MRQLKIMRNSSFIDQAKKALKEIKGNTLSVKERKLAAIKLATLLVQEAKNSQTQKESRLQKKRSQIILDPLGKSFIIALTDQIFRSTVPQRIADELISIIDKFGVPSSLPFEQQAQLLAFKGIGRFFPRLLIPLVKAMTKKEFSKVIFPEEGHLLIKHSQERKKEGLSLNLNHLGEAILGEEEAEKRIQSYLHDLKNPEIDCISVKISSIYSQIDLVAWEYSKKVLKEKLSLLYRVAQNHYSISTTGEKKAKFVYLDMEEYRDLHLTVDLFKSLLEEPEFFHFYAGIALQSYLPDSYIIQQELTLWAKKRVASGGAPIKIRIVKGANLLMEQIESSQKGWPQSPFPTKREVDANFKRMIQYGCEPENASAVHLGIGSHNLFDIAYSMILREENQLQKTVHYEMLEGMADSTARVISQLADGALLYCPVVRKESFQYAIAYLMRRLEESTSAEDFLRVSFDLSPNTDAWENQASYFSDSCDIIDSLPSTARRKQNRLLPPIKLELNTPFINEPDTDWSITENRKWAGEIYHSLSHRKQFPPKNSIENVVEVAKGKEEQWGKSSIQERSALLAQVAQMFRERRKELIQAMILETKKNISEADVEISEAIDFLEYYRREIEELSTLKELKYSPKGTVLIAPPWNFPCSIPTGGIAAALVTGNCVLFKPAPEAVLVGWEVVKAFWDAGVDREILQFLTCDDEMASQLVQDSKVNCVILTGGTQTARHLLTLRPDLDLIAETGGKNAIIVTSMADRDLAIKSIVQSAFGYSGQKCSACSLLILEAEVYDDLSFLNQLRDAVASLPLGSAQDPSTKINPLIRAPGPDLLRALTTLEPGETWLLEPKESSKIPYLWSPGIKLGVIPGSYTHQTEFFGPVLAVIRAKNLNNAIQIANGTPYGLTSGLQTLDEREQKYWIDHIAAGNCYINRGITGAIVRRQPFGGFKASHFGRGAKAGGPNYLTQLMNIHNIEVPSETAPITTVVALLSRYVENRLHPQELSLWHASLGNYAFYWTHYFSKDHDPSQVLGEQNILRYVELKDLIFRVQEVDKEIDIMRVIAAALTCGTPLLISCADDRFDLMAQGEWFKQLPEITLKKESEERFISRIKQEKINKVRMLSTPSKELQRIFAEEGCSLLHTPVLANGRMELLNYLREVTIVIETHRYGFIGSEDHSS